MSFTTLTFAVFLLVVLTLYWNLGRFRRAQNLLLVVGSYGFYAWWDYRFCGLMLASSLIDFAIGLSIDGTDPSARRRRRLLLVASVCANVGLLGFFKYYGFFVDNAIALLSSFGVAANPSTLHIILPVGISFYTFQTMSYTIDIYRGTMRPTRQLIDYMAFVSFFPQLVAGPIERASNLLPQFLGARVFDYDRAVDGCRQILWGAAKKLLIADNLAVIVNQAYAKPSASSGPELALATFCFAWQIYADFSGYSDIAIGTARLFGINLKKNFANPYFSQTVSEFWRRWHISLSTWFRDYVYIPMGGSRSEPARRVRNVLFTFCLSGLWHGSSWNFVIWGVLNGAAILPAALSGTQGIKRRPSDAPAADVRTLARITATFAFICLTWVFFRAETLADAMTVFGIMATGLVDAAGYKAALGQFAKSRMATAAAALVLMVLAEWLQRRRDHPLAELRIARPLRWATYTAILWLTITFQGPTGAFIYFQF